MQTELRQLYSDIIMPKLAAIGGMILTVLPWLQQANSLLAVLGGIGGLVVLTLSGLHIQEKRRLTRLAQEQMKKGYNHYKVMNTLSNDVDAEEVAEMAYSTVKKGLEKKDSK